MKQDLQIFDLIKKEKERQSQGLELIASENYVSDQVMDAMGSICTNKYAEGYPGKRYYGGCEVVDQIEQLAIDRLCAIYGAEYANVQPHSGAQANLAVEIALLNPGDTFMGLDLSQGGHLTHVLQSMRQESYIMQSLTALIPRPEESTTTRWKKLPANVIRNSSSAVHLPTQESGIMPA